MVAQRVLLLIQSWFLLHLTSSALASFFRHTDTEYHDTVHLKDVTPRAFRNKRSANEMPEQLHFDFHTGNDAVSLRLRRSEHIDISKIPLYTVGDDQKIVKVDLPPSVDAAVYSDINNMAAVLVTKPQDGNGLQLHGSLQIGDKDFMLRATESRFSSTNRKTMHTLRKVEIEGNFGLDYMEPEDDSEKVVTDMTRKGSRNNRQSGTSRRNVEINLVCDYGCYADFLQRHGQNSTLAYEDVQFYYSYMAQALDVRYRTITNTRPDVLITVTPVSVIVATTASAAPYSENNRVGSDGVNGNQMLRDFRSWASNAGLPSAATHILFTGYNMMTNGQTSGSGQLGVGYVGTACGYSKVVAVEERYQATTGMIAAHELGHNLNSIHDSTYSDSDSRCAGNSARYIMSAYIGFPVGSSNPWTFSSCSANIIADFVTVTKPSCFSNNYVDKVPDDEGQVYNADAQCAFALGQEAYFCRGKQIEAQGFDGLCTRMYCSATPTESSTCVSIIAREFTSCGDQKWCIRGQCVSSPSAPSKVSDSCAQGDDPTYGCEPSMCGDSLARNIFCCQMCATGSETTTAPTQAPTTTAASTQAPTTTEVPTQAPTTTEAPTQAPTTTAASTQAPTTTEVPTQAPTTTEVPTQAPTTTAASTQAPTTTEVPTQAPTTTEAPTQAPTTTEVPTQAPTTTEVPTQAPTTTAASTQAPTTTEVPTQAPTTTEAPTQAPTTTEVPTQAPTTTEPPTQAPTTTEVPTQAPTTTAAPTQAPTAECPAQRWQ